MALLCLAAPLALAQTKPAPSPSPAKAVATPALPLSRAVDSLSDDDTRQALELLRANYVRSGALDETTLNRATLQGLLERLGGGVAIRPEATGAEAESPFRAEILDDRIGYVRLGALTRGHLAEFDAALGNFTAKKVGSLILDLRATGPSSDFELAADLIMRLTPKGKLLFTIHRPSLKQERMHTSNRDPLFQGVAVTLVHRETAGAPEVIAAVLRTINHALTVGQKTAGQAAEFVELPLRGGKLLRVAVAEVKLQPNQAIFPDGLKPDLGVDVSAKDEAEVLKIGLQKGVGGLVFETERPRLNEAALVAGTNPEIDAEEAAQRNENRTTDEKAPLYDAVLQRAVDLVTTLRIFGSKAP